MHSDLLVARWISRGTRKLPSARSYVLVFVQFQNKIGEFLSIVNASFDAFVDTYKSAFPPTSNVEYQFVMGLLGIVTNVSASPEGREFLITNSNGMEFVRKMVELTPELPLAPGSLSLTRYVPRDEYLLFASSFPLSPSAVDQRASFAKL